MFSARLPPRTVGDVGEGLEGGGWVPPPPPPPPTTATTLFVGPQKLPSISSAWRGLVRQCRTTFVPPHVSRTVRSILMSRPRRCSGSGDRRGTPCMVAVIELPLKFLRRSAARWCPDGLSRSFCSGGGDGRRRKLAPENRRKSPP